LSSSQRPPQSAAPRPARRVPRDPKAPRGPRSYTGEFLDLRTYAERFGVTLDAVRSQVARGVLPYRRLAGRIVIPQADLEKFLAALPGVSAEEALANIARRRGE
jgi:hypothetical protein